MESIPAAPLISRPPFPGAPGPDVVVCMGLPGSGKTYFAEQLVAAGWSRVSQDELGSRKRCEEQFRHLRDRCTRRIVVDRCNHTAAQRRIWLEMAQRGRWGTAVVACVWFDTPLDLCIRRAALRQDHPTLSGADAAYVIRKFAREFEPPTDAERQIFPLFRITPGFAYSELISALGFLAESTQAAASAYSRERAQRRVPRWSTVAEAPPSSPPEPAVRHRHQHQSARVHRPSTTRLLQEEEL